MLFLALMLLSVNVELTSLEGKVSASTSNDDWPMFHHDASHTGYSLSSSPVNVSQWNYSVRGNYFSDVVISNGSLYFSAIVDTGPVCTIYAVNASTGRLIWSSPDSSILFPIMPCPAVSHGIVYTATDAYNASTGQLMFNYTNNGGLTSPVIADGIIYLGQSNGTSSGVIALNAANGAKIWGFSVLYLTNNFPSGVLFPPAVADGIVYFSGDGVYALEALTGTLKWHFNEIGGAWGSIAAANGYVYVNDQGKLYCLNAITGTKIWNNTSGASQITPAIANGYVYTGPYAFNASDGTLIWNNTQLGLGTPSVANGMVYYAYYNFESHQILAYNAITGEAIWNFTINGRDTSYFTSTPIISNSILYITNNGILAIGDNSPQSSAIPIAWDFTIQFSAVLATIASIALALLIIYFKKPKKASW
jgi:outer membrane protein assembly factor BamB